MPRKLRMALTVDPSSGSSKRSNYFVIGVGGLDLYTMKLHVLDMFRQRLRPEDQADEVVRMFIKWYDQGLRLIGIEAVFRQSELVRQVTKKLRGFAVSVQPILRQKDKEMRLSGLAMRYSNGDVIHPESADGARPDWVEILEEELCLIGWEKGIQLHELDDQGDVVNDFCDLLTANLITEEFVPRHYKVLMDPRKERFPTPGKH